jgi:hypothetical protein
MPASWLEAADVEAISWAPAPAPPGSLPHPGPRFLVPPRFFGITGAGGGPRALVCEVLTSEPADRKPDHRVGSPAAFE